MNRDWIEKIADKVIKKHAPDIEFNEANNKKIYEMIDRSMPHITESVFEFLKKNRVERLKDLNKLQTSFKRRLKKRWGKAFDELRLFVAFQIEYGESLNYSYRNEHKYDVKFETIVRLHAWSCQVSNEILELISGGYADGAMARWRTLYEISVIANFLGQRPNILSQRFLDYHSIERYKEAITYQEHCKELEFEPIEENEINSFKEAYDEMALKYGEDFLKPYGWVGEFMPKKKRNFAGIEQTVDFRKMRPYYKMANKNIHSGVGGLVSKLGQIGNEVLLAGPSNYGFADPAQCTSYSLMQTTIELSQFDEYLEADVYLNISEKMFVTIRDDFLKIQKDIEKEDLELMEDRA